MKAVSKSGVIVVEAALRRCNSNSVTATAEVVVAGLGRGGHGVTTAALGDVCYSEPSSRTQLSLAY